MIKKLYILVLTLTLSIIFGSRLFAQSGSETFTSSGTFTVPANVTSINIELVGAGGSGGGNGGGGGGGGGYASGVYTVVPLSVYDVTVGIPGGGAASGTSSVGSLISATGGENGTWVPNPNLGGGGAGGVGSNGTISNRTGGTGGGGYWTYFGGGGGGAAGSVSNGFNGGNTILWTGNCLTPGGDGGLSGGTPGGAGGKGAGFTDLNCNVTNPAGNGENYGGGGGGGNGNGGIPGTGIGGYVFISWGIVPVELSSFTAEVINDEVVLKWQTATETNNQGFEVERLQDYKIGKLQDLPTGQAGWETIGFVPGFGTTAETKSYSYADQSVKSGINYYRLKQIDFDGSFEYSQEVEVEIAPPLRFSLEQNYPNPFNPTTTIKFQIPGQARNDIVMVTLKVYDVLGNEIAALVNEEKQAGSYEVEFSASALTSGIYYYQLRAGNFVETKKMVLMK